MKEQDLIGTRLKKAREKSRYTQKDAATKLGIHNSTLGKYELGEREADIETIKKIAELYEVSPQWILFGEDNKKAEGKNQDSLDLVKQEAEKLGLSPDDPVFKKMLSDAFDLLRLARRKDIE